MIAIVLVEPKNSGNVGAAARAMANFGFENLILVNPKCNHLSQTARNRAKWANGILKNAKVAKDFSSLKKFSALVATTGRMGTDYNIPRSPISPEQFAGAVDISKNIAVVFGRESSGLTNEEISKCDFVVAIPTSKKYPIMNLSHAVSIVLYELSKKSLSESVSSHVTFASAADKEQVMKMLKKALAKMEFATDEKKQTQIKVWKRMIGKSFLTKREAFALMGFFRKIS